MKSRIVFFWFIVFAVLAFVLFRPYGISASGPKQYKVIEVSYKNDLEYQVTTAINDGWSLVGGVATDGTFYVQALVK